MSAEIVNLRRVRKAKARAERKIEADANSIKFGRSKADKARADAERSLAERAHANHKREEGDGTA